MSYCRWSTDKMKCDIYAYESEAGYVVHVRSQRPINSHILPDMPWGNLEWFNGLPKEERLDLIDQWQTNHRALFNWLIWEDIELEHAGETFGFDTEEEMFEFMRELKGMGYYVPLIEYAP